MRVCAAAGLASSVLRSCTAGGAPEIKGQVRGTPPSNTPGGRGRGLWYMTVARQSRDAISGVPSPASDAEPPPRRSGAVPVSQGWGRQPTPRRHADRTTNRWPPTSPVGASRTTCRTARRGPRPFWCARWRFTAAGWGQACGPPHPRAPCDGTHRSAVRPPRGGNEMPAGAVPAEHQGYTDGDDDWGGFTL